MLGGHALHVIPLLVPVIAVLGVLGPDMARAAVRRSVPLLVASVASALAAGVHLVVMPEHFRESLLFGSFFLVLAVAEIGFGVLLWLVRLRSLVLAGVLGNAATVLLWLVTRTVGLPFGPWSGVAEPIGFWDLLAVAAEVTTLLALRPVLAQRAPRHRAWRGADAGFTMTSCASSPRPSLLP